MADEKVRTEEFQVRGEEIVAKIKELLHEGNIRRVIIKNEEGRTMIDIPLTIGVVGVILLPVWAAIGAAAALVAGFKAGHTLQATAATPQSSPPSLSAPYCQFACCRSPDCCCRTRRPPSP